MSAFTIIFSIKFGIFRGEYSIPDNTFYCLQVGLGRLMVHFGFSWNLIILAEKNMLMVANIGDLGKMDCGQS